MPQGLFMAVRANQIALAEPKASAKQKRSRSQRIERHCLPKTPSRTTSEAIVDSTFPSRRIRVQSWIWGKKNEEIRKGAKEKRGEKSEDKGKLQIM